MVTEQFQSHIAYTPDSDEKYSLLAVKTLIEANEDVLLKARMITRNGKDRIVYIVDGMGSYLALKKDISNYMRKEVFESLIHVISIVKRSPFWDLEYIDLRKEHIYLDQNTDTVKFAVVPRVFNDINTAKIEWTEQLLALFFDVTKEITDDPDVSRIMDECVKISEMPEVLDRYRETQKLIERLADNYTFTNNKRTTDKNVRNVILEYSSDGGHFTFVDTIDDFVIGKDNSCDGIVNISQAISRRHCVLEKRDGRIKLKDLGSTNGTWLNGERVSTDDYREVKDKDTLKIADIAFTVHFEY